jgi:hypothetical protein
MRSLLGYRYVLEALGLEKVKEAAVIPGPVAAARGCTRKTTRVSGRHANTMFYLQFLFLEPNASDPLNKDAAEDLKANREGFKRNVRAAMGGGSVKGVSFERVLK